jgi:hypothetical protein
MDHITGKSPCDWLGCAGKLMGWWGFDFIFLFLVVKFG